MRTAAAFAAWFILSALCAACDDSIATPPTPAACAQIGAQCQLPGGPLGVCQRVTCAAGAPPPCFTCTSQH